MVAYRGILMGVLGATALACGKSSRDEIPSSAGASGAGGAANSAGSGGSAMPEDESFGPEATQAVSDYCAAQMAAYDACDVPASARKPCVEVWCFESVYSSDNFVDYVACQIAKPCEAFLMGHEDCINMVAGGITPEMEEWYTNCRARVAECDPDPPTDICGVVSPVVRRGLFDEVSACLEGACDGLSACLDPIDFGSCFG